MMPSRPFPLGLGEVFRTVRFAVMAESDQPVTWQDRFQPLLALEKRLFAQVHCVLKHKIKSAIQELRFVAQRVLKQLEMRDAVFSDRDELAVDHGVALHALQRFGDLDIAAADDFAVAAVQRNLATPDFRDHPEAIVLVLENPAGVVERRVGERSEHRL
jgi:hypothetical protein